MKLLIDAQLPRRMVQWFQNAGHDAMHTFDLPDGNRTTDEQVIAIADAEQRVVATKDDDFVVSHLLRRKPKQLLLVSTGNISNNELEQIVCPLIPTIALNFETASFVELGRDGICIRGT